MARLIVRLLVIVVFLSGYSWKKQDEMTVNCGDPTVSAVPMVKALDWSYAFGAANRRLATPGGAPTFNEIHDLVYGTMGVIKLMADQAKRGWDGVPEGGVANGIRSDVEGKKAELLAQCCPTIPKATTVSVGEPLTGAALAADALRRAAPTDRKWLKQIPLGVAIAHYESSFRPAASNTVLSGHVGFWQISGDNAAHFKLGDRTDPYANARYAHALWKGRGGTWSKDWTVYPTAAANVDQFRQYSKPQPPVVEAPEQGCGEVASVDVEEVVPATIPSERVEVDGKAVSAVTAAQLRLVEAKTGKDLTVMQGGYGGAHYDASGTSHNYPGVVDVACSGASDCVGTETAMRMAGFAAWARNVTGRSKVGSGEHVHGVSLLDAGDKDAPQVKWSWPNHGNGLDGWNNDPAPHVAWYPNLLRQLTGATT